MDSNILKIIITFGGLDKESNISLATVRSFIDHCSYSHNIELFFLNNDGIFFSIDLSMIYANTYEDFYNLLINKNSYSINNLLDYLKNQWNILVFNTIHGRFGEDGQWHQLLQNYNIPFIGSCDTMDLTFNKLKWNNMMKKYNYKNIEYYSLPMNNFVQLDNLKNHWKSHKSYILKPIKSGSSLGVKKIDNREELWMIIIDYWNTYGDMILEEFFEGIEFSMVLIDPQWSWQPPCNIIYFKTKDIYTYEKKYMINEDVKYLYHQKSVSIEKELLNQGQWIAQHLKLKGIHRLDGIINENNQYIFNDCNGIPSIYQNSLLLKTKIGSLKNIFNNLIEQTIKLYYPNYNDLITNYQKVFFNEDCYDKSINTIKNFLNKIGHKKEHLDFLNKDFSMDINIITGGNSTEKNVSLLSGSNVFLQLNKSSLFSPKIFCWHHNNLYPMDYGDCGFNTVDNLLLHLSNGIDFHQWINQQDKNIFIFLAVHGGDGENGWLQSQLKGHLYNGCDSYWSKIFMDKYGTSLIINKPSYPRILLDLDGKKFRYNLKDTWKNYENNSHWNYFEGIENFYKELRLLNIDTWCCKPNNEGSSVGIAIINNEESFLNYIEDCKKKNITTIIIEKFINCKKNIATDCSNPLDNKIINVLSQENNDDFVELTLGIINGFCLRPSITLSHGQFLSMEEKFQYGCGVNLMESHIIPEKDIIFIQDFMSNLMNSIKFNSYCRIDCFFNITTKVIYIIEINSLPALTPATVLYTQGAQEGLSQQQLLEVIILNDYLNKL